MKKILFLSALLFVIAQAHCQTLTPQQCKAIKDVYQESDIHLPDSSIVYPLAGITNIVNKANNREGKYAEIEYWIVDATGKVIYNSTITKAKYSHNTTMDTEYCRYMKLQNNYALHQRNKSHS
ncbi:MAG: hypothetical protein JWO58_937 [Chitinophagaceae bacterium]|nr:hypothetical protein [Chitinophagaceae bacterium]